VGPEVIAVTGEPAGFPLLESFLNSVDVETGADDLDTPERYSHWLGQHGYPDTVADATDLRDALQLRDALRAAARRHHDAAEPDGALDALAGRIRLRARFTPDGVRLVSAETGARGILGDVLATVVLADADGSWQRIKICREDTCQWVFFDRSKNTSKQWCSMQGCGNRNKTRAYRARQRS
jgi:predicted RNA-binding Zn ribbon-like protein